MTTAVADPVSDAIDSVLALHRPVRVRPDCLITENYLAALGGNREGIWIETDRGELIISGASAENVPAVAGDLGIQVGIARRGDIDSLTRFMDGGYWPPGWEAKIPDVSWISAERIALLPPGPKPAYWPIAPEFVIEVRSRNDSLSGQQEKMVGWTTHGVLLGLLVDPVNHNVHIYRDGEEQQVLHRPDEISCEPEMPGLILDFARIWRIAGA